MEEKPLAFMLSILAILCRSVCCQTIGVWLESVPCDLDGVDGYRSRDPGLWDIATGNRYLPEYTGESRTGLSCTDGDVFYVDPDQAPAPQSTLLSSGLTDVSGSSLTMNGAFPAARAFNGNYGDFFHTESETDPWLKGDIGQVFAIIGAMFTSRGSGGSLTTNLHLLVADTDVELSDYESSLCHAYPGPPMDDSQIEWLPCAPAKSGRYFKITIIGTQKTLVVAELEIYGY